MVSPAFMASMIFWFPFMDGSLIDVSLRLVIYNCGRARPPIAWWFGRMWNSKVAPIV
jgi:hypothetical protein